MNHMSHGNRPEERNDQSHDRPPRMPLVDALRVLLGLRGEDDIVVTTMSAAREWPRLSDSPLDFHYIPSTMGGGPPLGLGLALAQPDREVLVLTGDGSLLMNLGSLVSIIDSGATNLTVAVLDNAVYEVTGGQRTAAAQSQTDYAGIARACGFPNVAQFSHLVDFQRRASRVLQRPGPRFMWLQVEAVREGFELDPPGPMSERLQRFQKALATA